MIRLRPPSPSPPCCSPLAASQQPTPARRPTPAAPAAPATPAPDANALTADGLRPAAHRHDPRRGRRRSRAMTPIRTPVGGAEPETCDQFHPARAPEGLLVMIENGVLTRITLAAPARRSRPIAASASATPPRPIKARLRRRPSSPAAQISGRAGRGPLRLGDGRPRPTLRRRTRRRAASATRSARDGKVEIDPRRRPGDPAGRRLLLTPTERIGDSAGRRAKPRACTPLHLDRAAP